MSVVPEHAPTKTQVARFWAFTWFPKPGVTVMERDGSEPTRHANFDATKLGAGENWPMCSVGSEEECTGLVFQVEVCPDTGREHVQGYAEFPKPCRFQFVQALLGITGAHCEGRKKSREACVKYCTKDETRKPDTQPVLLGSLAEQDPTAYKTRQGKRTDISAMVDAIKSGKRAIECLEQDPDTYVKYSRGMQEVRRIVQQSMQTRGRPELKVTVYWGEAGTGKTRRVYDTHGFENVFTLIADNSACWFDGYEGQDVLLIDDFKGWIQYSLLLKVLDIYPLRLPVKGSFTYAAWTKVYITSNYDPKTWYTGDHDPAALARRIHSVIQFGAVHGAAARGALPRASAATTGAGALLGATGGAGAGGAAMAPGFNPPSPLTRSPAFYIPARLLDSDDEQTDNDEDDSA